MQQYYQKLKFPLTQSSKQTLKTTIDNSVMIHINNCTSHQILVSSFPTCSHPAIIIHFLIIVIYCPDTCGQSDLNKGMWYSSGTYPGDLNIMSSLQGFRLVGTV